MRQQDLEGRSYIWSFVTPELVVYRYAPSRSGSIPKQVLGDSQGRLVVDMYTGYNAVTKPGEGFVLDARDYDPETRLIMRQRIKELELCA